MKKRVLSVLAVAGVLLTNIIPIYAENEKSICIYVASDGKTDGDGSIGNPFATITAADSYVEELKKSLNEETEIQVILRGGEYRIDSDILLSSSNTGFSNDKRVIYRAMDGETPVIKGSKLLDISAFSEITDEAVLSKLNENAKENIVVLDLKKQGITKLSGDFSSKIKSIPYVNLYLNDLEQSVAQWPNGDYNYSSYTVDKTDGSVIYPKESGKADKWKNETDAVFSGFFDAWEYTDTLFDMTGVTASGGLKLSTDGLVSNSNTKRFKMLNLLSELDVPGEWYLNKSEMKLYYYPQHELDTNDKLEISLFYDTLFKVSNGASNISFEGITFSQMCGDVIGGLVNGNSVNENITVDKCTFTDIGGSAVNLYSYTYCPFYDHEEWQNRVAKVKNVAVTNNIFYNMHGGPITIHSGNPETLESYGVVVKNNYSNQPYSYNVTKPMLIGNYNTIGAVIENNLAHNVSKNALEVMGSYNKINYNEIAHTTREVADAGAFYSGRTIMQRRNEYGYNFFNEVNPAQSILMPYSANRAIYFDDSYSGGYIHHNIIVNGEKSLSTSGSGSEISNNISVECPNGIHLGVWEGVDRYSKLLSEENLSKDNVKWYLKQFPEIQEEYKTIKASDFTVTTGNKVTGNLTVYGKNPEDGLNDVMINSNIFSGNIRKNSYDDFVNPDALDFRIKKDSESYLKNNKLLSEDFDISQIGIQWNEGFDKTRITSRRHFDIIQPVDNSFKKDNIVHLMWEKAFDADMYRVVVAKDEAFSGVLKTIDVPYNYWFLNLDEFDSEDLYWKVYAVNETRSMNGEWEAEHIGHMKITDTVTEDVGLSIKNAVVSGKTLNVEFSKSVDAASLDGQIHLYDANNIETDRVEYILNDNVLDIILPDGFFNSVFSVVLDKEISSGEETLGQKYVASSELIGFSEDFGESYSDGDWQYQVKTGGSVSSFALSHSANVTDGVLYVSNNESAVTTERTAVFKKDYEDYSLSDFVLEFDYKRCAVTATDDFEVFLRANRGGDKRYLPIYGTGWRLFVNNAYSMTFRYGKLHMGKAVNTESFVKNSTDASAPNIIDVWYRYKVEAKDEGNLTKIKVYSARYQGDTYGDYELLKEYSYSKDKTLTEGTVAFSVCKDGGAALDNVTFSELKTVEFRTIDEMNTYILSETDKLKQISEDVDYSKKADELCRIGALINTENILSDIPLKIINTYLDSNKLVFEFNMPISVANGSVALVEEDKKLNCYANDNLLYAEIPGECFNKEHTTSVSGFVSEYGNTMPEEYTESFSIYGFFDDFSGSSSGWQYRNCSNSGNAPLKDGMLRIGDKSDVALLVNRKDYLDYMYENAVLEYDYLMLSNQSNSWQESAGPILGINSETAYVENWIWKFNDGYAFINWYDYEKMYFIKNNKSDIAERSAEVLQYAQQLETGKKYRYRIIKQTEGEKINFNIYRAEYDGEFIGEYKFITCTSAPVPENNIGSFLFYTYKGTDILIDNVLYRDIDKYGIKLIENGENVEIFNTHAISGDVTVVLAYYNGDKLVKAMPETINFGENEAKKELPIQTAITEEYDKIKVFVWGSLKSLKPLAHALIK